MRGFSQGWIAEKAGREHKKESTNLKGRPLRLFDILSMSAWRTALIVRCVITFGLLLVHSHGLLVTGGGAALALGGPLASYPALSPSGVWDDSRPSVIYDAGSGRIMVEPPQGQAFTSVLIESGQSIFTEGPAEHLGGDFDLHEDARVFKAVFAETFSALSFGKVARSGLAESFVQGDLTVQGTLEQGIDLEEVDLIYIPGKPGRRGLASGGRLRDEQTSIFYDAHSGSFRVDAAAGMRILSIDISSAAGILELNEIGSLDGIFDSHTQYSIYKVALPGGFSSVILGRLAPGLGRQTLLEDLTVSGALQHGRDLGVVDLVYVPEPKAALLMLLGMAGLAISRCGFLCVRAPSSEGLAGGRLP